MNAQKAKKKKARRIIFKLKPCEYSHASAIQYKDLSPGRRRIGLLGSRQHHLSSVGLTPVVADVPLQTVEKEEKNNAHTGTYTHKGEPCGITTERNYLLEYAGEKRKRRTIVG